MSHHPSRPLASFAALLLVAWARPAHADYSGYEYSTRLSSSINITGPNSFKGIPPYKSGYGPANQDVARIILTPSYYNPNGLSISYQITVDIIDLAALNALRSDFEGFITTSGTLGLKPRTDGSGYDLSQTVDPAVAPQVIGDNLYRLTPVITFQGFVPEGPERAIINTTLQVFISVTPVPEPSTLALTGLGAAGGLALGAARRRRTSLRVRPGSPGRPGPSAFGGSTLGA